MSENIKKPAQRVRDAKGDLHEYRVLSLLEVVQLEKRIGGCFQLHGAHMSYGDIVWVLTLGLGVSEEDIFAKFDVHTGPVAAAKIIEASVAPRSPNKGGSLDDQ